MKFYSYTMAFAYMKFCRIGFSYIDVLPTTTTIIVAISAKKMLFRVLEITLLIVVVTYR